MKFINGTSRHQIEIYTRCLDETVEKDNEVRIIDLFVDSIKLKEFGFDMEFVDNGRPAYHPADLLKLFIYGYLNKIRSSRDLEKECKRNIELIWLLKGLQPDHNTISNFRRDNPKAIKSVFRVTVKIAKHFDLIGGRLIAGDSTKLRAQNSKKSNYNQDKIDRHIAYIDNKIEEYNNILATADGDKKTEIEKAISKQTQRKQEYKSIEQQINETGQAQVSTSDPESRQMITRNNITEVAYNVQTTVDANQCLPIDYKVTNNNDSKAMGDMLRRAKSILRTNEFTALYDKGYHTGSEMKIAHELNITALVAVPDVASNAPDPQYNIANFSYDEQTNTYTCPEGNILSTNGSWYAKNRGKYRANVRVQQYKTTACKNCSKLSLCTKNARGGGRVLERSEFAKYLDNNKINTENNKELYKKRQAIVEHPYGTIKRQWGFNYILTKKGKARASSDVGFMFIAYNLRRLMNILDPEMLKKYLRILVLCFVSLLDLIRLQKLKYDEPKFLLKLFPLNFENSLNRLKFELKFEKTVVFRQTAVTN
ncbi:MAG: IS1182 family transposase, partial [Bacteroidota bacterium]